MKQRLAQLETQPLATSADHDLLTRAEREGYGTVRGKVPALRSAAAPVLAEIDLPSTRSTKLGTRSRKRRRIASHSLASQTRSLRGRHVGVWC